MFSPRQPVLDAKNLDFPEKLGVLFQPARYKVLYGGRNSTKSWGVARWLLISALTGSERVLCVRELQKSIGESVHKLLADQISLMGMNYLYEVQQAHIYGRGQASGSEFSFEGIRHNVEKVKSYEGISKCWVEEADKLKKDSYNILVPTIRKSGSELIFTFNPNLDDDFIYDHFVLKAPPPGSIVVKLTYRDNKWLSADSLAEIEHMKLVDPDEYLHVYEGQTKVTLEGAILAEELRDAVLAERIRHVSYDRSTSVDVYFDLGRNDYTCLWFIQRIGLEFAVIDYYENRLKHIDHYAKLMQSKPYLYGTLWLPHDGKAKQLGTKMSIQEQLQEFYPNRVKIAPKLSVEDKINAARTVFPRCYFDAHNCQAGIKGLRDWKYAIDPVTKRYAQVPDHNGSDPADAFCTFAVASGLRTRAPECKLERPRSSQLGLTALGGPNILTGLDNAIRQSANKWLGR